MTNIRFFYLTDGPKADHPDIWRRLDGLGEADDELWQHECASFGREQGVLSSRSAVQQRARMAEQNRSL
jgi:hypothetical protein